MPCKSWEANRARNECIHGRARKGDGSYTGRELDDAELQAKERLYKSYDAILLAINQRDGKRMPASGRVQQALSKVEAERAFRAGRAHTTADGKLTRNMLVEQNTEIARQGEKLDTLIAVLDPVAKAKAKASALVVEAGFATSNAEAKAKAQVAKMKASTLNFVHKSVLGSIKHADKCLKAENAALAKNKPQHELQVLRVATEEAQESAISTVKKFVKDYPDMRDLCGSILAAVAAAGMTISEDASSSTARL